MRMTSSGPLEYPQERRLIALTRVTDDANLVDSLRRVATAADDLVEHCSSASVTVIAGERPATMAATNDIATKLDRAQYDADDGPCLEAARNEQSVRIDALRAEARWPEFRRVGLHFGVLSSLSVPLRLEDADAFGGINVYGDVEAAFSAHDEQLVESFADQAAIVVSNAVAYWTMFDLSRNLTAAIEHRGVIEQAKGIVMAAERCSPDEAFAFLRRMSQQQNRKLRDIAIDVVESARRRDTR